MVTDLKNVKKNQNDSKMTLPFLLTFSLRSFTKYIQGFPGNVGTLTGYMQTQRVMEYFQVNFTQASGE